MYFIVYIFSEAKGRTRDSGQIDILGVQSALNFFTNAVLILADALSTMCGKNILETIYSTFLPWCCLPFVHVVF